jgi:hypothetical protein
MEILPEKFIFFDWRVYHDMVMGRTGGWHPKRQRGFPANHTKKYLLILFVSPGADRHL